jgi:hypothetical protein
MKKIDLLVDKGSKYLKIQVKSKQGNVWPGCKGVSDDDILVLVDYHKKNQLERPDYYILTAQDWLNLIHSNFSKQLETGELKITDGNIPLWVKHNYRGHSLPKRQVEEYKEKWEKIEKIVINVNEDNFQTTYA